MAAVKLLWRWVFGAVLALAFVLALAPSGEGEDWFNHADKVRHALAFAALWQLGRLARVQPGWLLAAGLLAFGASIEVAQGFTPHREASWLDWAADALGVLLAWAVLPHPWARRVRVEAEGGLTSR